MNYELLEDITSADIAIRVKAPSLNLLFKYGAEALMSELIENISDIKNEIFKDGVFEGDDISLLYFEFLNEFIFYKDAENLLLIPSEIQISDDRGTYSCRYIIMGEKIDRNIHKFKVDIKAVTLHGMRIYKDEGFFIAESVFDI